jgi:hypothetical protein
MFQFLPCAIRFFAKQDYVVLALIEVQTEASLKVTFTWPIVRAGDVIDMDKKSAALRVSEVNKFHRVSSSNGVLKNRIQLAAGNSR